MYLDAVRLNDDIADALTDYRPSRANPVYAAWKDWQPSQIMHHGSVCCEVAREWIASFDQSVLNGASVLTGPRWLRHRFEWGPVRYPIAWCEVLSKEVLDCGLHAALAHDVFTSRGVRCFRLQLIQEYSTAAALQWHTVWSSENAITDWINGNLIYHEGSAIQLENGRLKLWDASAGWWIDPKNVSGYGSVRAVRITGPKGRESFVWKDHCVIANVWNEVK